MKRHLAIVGAGGHGRVIADAALLGPWEAISFFDDAKPRGSAVGEWNIVGSFNDLLSRKIAFDGVVVGVGRNAARLSLHLQLRKAGFATPTIVHPNAQVSQRSRIGEGTVICSGAVISTHALVGESCIINTSSSVDHDCSLASGVHLSPGAHLAGGVEVGRCTWIGVGASVIENVRIGCDSTIGAGSVVIRDVADDVTVVGCPAKLIVRQDNA